jgi:hypothetical protein
MRPPLWTLVEKHTCTGTFLDQAPSNGDGSVTPVTSRKRDRVVTAAVVD